MSVNLFPNHPYWAIMEPWTSKGASIFGADYYEFFLELGPKDELWKLTPLVLMEKEMRKMILDSQGIDSKSYEYKVDRSLMLHFTERKYLLAFVLKFRDGLIVWRTD
jgi:hypothetical protein